MSDISAGRHHDAFEGIGRGEGDVLEFGAFTVVGDVGDLLIGAVGLVVIVNGLDHYAAGVGVLVHRVAELGLLRGELLDDLVRRDGRSGFIERAVAGVGGLQLRVAGLGMQAREGIQQKTEQAEREQTGHEAEYLLPWERRAPKSNKTFHRRKRHGDQNWCDAPSLKTASE